VTFAPDDVRALYRHLSVTIGFKVARKEDSEIMRLGARIVEAVTGGRIDAATFLRSYATTIPLPWGATVFLPFEPGTPSPEWSLEAQAFVATHEAQHAAQWHREGVAWPVLYSASTAWRARYETEAQSAADCFRFHATGQLGDPAHGAAGLASYGCSVGDVAVSAEELRLDHETIRAGGIPHRAAAEAISWWRALLARNAGVRFDLSDDEGG